MNRKLQKAVRQQKKNTKQEIPQFTGLLGMPLDGKRQVEVSGRNAYVYVRLRNNESEVIQAFNNQVAPSYNLPVIVERQGNRYTVIAVDTQRYENNWTSFSPFLPRHGNTHSFDIESGGGGDIVWVHSKQLMPLLIIPSGTLGAPNVVMSSYTLRKEDGSWMYVGNTGTQVFSNYLPSSPTGAIMGLVYLDTNSGNPRLIINSGTVFPNSLTGTNQVVPYIPSVPSPSTQIPLAAVRLVTGTSQITWNNIYDVRQWLHTVPTGTGGGGGGTVITGTTIQDEGVSQGVVGTLNFVGNGVNASVAGGVATITVTGSSGGVSSLTGTSIGLPNTISLTNSSGFLNTHPGLAWGLISNKPYFEFGSNVNKESNAGRFGYEIFSPGYMEWVGAGTGTPRWHRFYDNTRTTVSQADNVQLLNFHNSWAWFNGTGLSVGPNNATVQTTITGSDYLLGMNGNTDASMRTSVSNLAQAVVYSGVIGTFLGGVQVTAGNTFYSCPFKDTANTTQNEFPWPDAGIMENLTVRISANQPAGGSLVITLQVNNVDTGMVVTIPAGSTNGSYTNTTNTVVFNENDTIKWKIQNNAPAASSANLTAISMRLRKRATA